MKYLILIALVVTSIPMLAYAGSNSKSIKWLAENAEKEGVITLKSGLQYKVLQTGSGQSHPTVDSSLSRYISRWYCI